MLLKFTRVLYKSPAVCVQGLIKTLNIYIQFLLFKFRLFQTNETDIRAWRVSNTRTSWLGMVNISRQGIPCQTGFERRHLSSLLNTLPPVRRKGGSRGGAGRMGKVCVWATVLRVCAGLWDRGLGSSPRTIKKKKLTTMISHAPLLMSSFCRISTFMGKLCFIYNLHYRV